MTEIVPHTGASSTLDHATIKQLAEASMQQIDNYVTWKAKPHRWGCYCKTITIAGEEWITVSDAPLLHAAPLNRGTHPKQGIVVWLPPNRENARGMELFNGRKDLKILIRRHTTIDTLLFTCIQLVLNPNISESNVALIYVDTDPMYIPYVNSILSTRFAGRFVYRSEFTTDSIVPPTLRRFDVHTHKSIPLFATQKDSTGRDVLMIIGKDLMSTVITGVPDGAYSAWVLRGLPTAVLLYYVANLPDQVTDLTIEGHITPQLLFLLFNRHWGSLKIQFKNPVNEQHVAVLQCAVDRETTSVSSLMLQDMVFSENNARFILRPVLQLKNLSRLVIKTSMDFLCMNRPEQRAEWIGYYLSEIAARRVNLVFDWPTGIIFPHTDFRVLLSDDNPGDGRPLATFAIRSFDRVEPDKPYTGRESKLISRERLIPLAKSAWGQTTGASSEFDYDAVYDSFP